MKVELLMKLLDNTNLEEVKGNYFYYENLDQKLKVKIDNTHYPHTTFDVIKKLEFKRSVEEIETLLKILNDSDFDNNLLQIVTDSKVLECRDVSFQITTMNLLKSYEYANLLVKIVCGENYLICLNDKEHIELIKKLKFYDKEVYRFLDDDFVKRNISPKDIINYIDELEENNYNEFVYNIFTDKNIYENRTLEEIKILINILNKYNFDLKAVNLVMDKNILENRTNKEQIALIDEIMQCSDIKEDANLVFNDENILKSLNNEEQLLIIEELKDQLNNRILLRVINNIDLLTHRSPNEIVELIKKLIEYNCCYPLELVALSVNIMENRTHGEHLILLDFLEKYDCCPLILLEIIINKTILESTNFDSHIKIIKKLEENNFNENQVKLVKNKEFLNIIKIDKILEILDIFNQCNNSPEVLQFILNNIENDNLVDLIKTNYLTTFENKIKTIKSVTEFKEYLIELKKANGNIDVKPNTIVYKLKI